MYVHVNLHLTSVHLNSPPPPPPPSAGWESGVCCLALCHQTCVLQVGEGPAKAHSGARRNRDKFPCYQEHPEKDGRQACSLRRYQQPLWPEGKQGTGHFPPMVLPPSLIPSLSSPLPSRTTHPSLSTVFLMATFQWRQLSMRPFTCSPTLCTTLTSVPTLRVP